MRVEPYSQDRHEAFVMNAVRRRSRDWPWTPADEPYLVELARRCLATGRCLVGCDDADPDLLYGFALIEGPQAVTMAYTKSALRGPGAFGAPVGTPRDPQCPPVASALLEAGGIDVSKPLSVSIWSVSASRIAARGYPCYPATP
jgi:hypothetical protein